MPNTNGRIKDPGSKVFIWIYNVLCNFYNYESSGKYWRMQIKQ
jgi:hypothetical protein